MTVAAEPQAATIEAQLQRARHQLASAAVEEPRRTAGILLAAVLDCDQTHLFAYPERVLTEPESACFADLVDRRAAGEPIQYLTGVREFFGRDFEVNSTVLIPRPETEFLIEAVLGEAPDNARILDLCTGSGCIATTLACEQPNSQVFATDISADALRIAQRNSGRYDASVSFLQGDLLDAVRDESFDVIVCNPPYVSERDRVMLSREVKHEPSLALFAGTDGLAIYRRLIPAATRVLRPGGLLVLELGYDSLPGVRELLGEWDRVEIRPDLAGVVRVALARCSPFASR
jgi:release factor glutamine methyltransferase